MKIILSLTASLTALVTGSALAEAPQPSTADWPYTGGSIGFNRYSDLDQINKDNVKGLHVLWTRPAVDSATAAKYPKLRVGRYFRSTPIKVGDVIYTQNGIGLVEAMDPATGRSLWVQQPVNDSRAELAGNPSRGVAFWRDGEQSRIIAIRGQYLYSVDAKTGAADHAFGTDGRVSLNIPESGIGFMVSGGPLVVDNVVIIGGGESGDSSEVAKSYPEPVRAYDVRTGKKLWEFSPMPARDDPERASWQSGSAEIGGDMGSYGQLSADPDLHLVYVPFSSPDPPAYGGWRPGNNLYGTSLVAIDYRTGKKVWHYQMIHHDIWDYDLSAPPVLGDVTIDGVPRKIVMQLGKMPLLFVLDRATGKPIWPIVERPVPQSDAPGEHTAATQPIPTKPEPLDRVSVQDDDLIDFTPALKAEARAMLKDYRHGSIYIPPSVKSASNLGTLTLPGTDGGGNWNAGAFDPRTGVYYGMTVSVVSDYALVKPGSDSKLPFVMEQADNNWAAFLPSGLPLVKPPYGRITAVDMSTGDKRWIVANGDGPRNDPKLAPLKLPQLGNAGRVAVAVTKSLIFAPEASDVVFFAAAAKGAGNKFRAYDKDSGAVLAEISLPAGATAAPITYSVNGKQLILVAVGGTDAPAQWVALGL